MFVTANPGIAIDITKAKLDAESKTQDKALMQKTTQYLIVGTIVVVILIIAVIAIRKKYAP